MVGIFKLLVINFEASGEMHSKTIEKAPAFSIFSTSFKSFLAFKYVSPSTLNLFLN